MIAKIRSLADKARGRLVMLAHDDRGSGIAENVVMIGIFVAIAVIVGKLFGDAIVTEAGKVANQITGQ
ncbi:hypothetical protein Caci_8596 [Catenulispora acidiphila DSM 44928]|uniref:Uncharacterized protein n=1 Tax=Catenulispora acidiphila (strain DSM 44928 / JCM 14897 / NBRC 102108 / NRRL B-24433 / ID139908) TaxID=479433 RepID=C7PYU3_CATAD|nr:hypothetical protein [Catenulispora acidiphila]ACU77415.1 hypothetical protein Caci_8596 [Catenulispora acidiphila DSM 44928]